MSAPKSERLMNLTICLLVARTHLTREEIRERVTNYHDMTQQGFERMFERDKDELRSLGVPIETRSADASYSGEPGYRIRPDEYALPDVALTPAEAAAVGLAAQMWDSATMAARSGSAGARLWARDGADGADGAGDAHGSHGTNGDRAADADDEPDLPAGLAPVSVRVAADDPAFEPLWSAINTRTAVRFEHASGRSVASSLRHLQPWGVVNVHGHWYVVGWDTDRGAVRRFRLSRITGAVAPDSEPGSYQIPEDLDLKAEAVDLGSRAERTAGRTAVVRVAAGAGNGLRRRSADVHDRGDGWADLQVPLTDGLAAEICGYGPDAIAIEPDDLVEEVRAGLARVAVGVRP